MTLSALIKKGGLAERMAATATLATVATQETDQPVTVATVATVAVAKQPESISAGNSDQERSILLETLADVCRGLGITPVEVFEALSPEDIADWRKGELGSDTLTAFARSLVLRRQRDRGERPAHYTEQATCKRCGPIWLWVSGEVLGCPWCWNRVADKPIPRPCSIHCGDCIHFERIDHPHLGHCTKGEPEAIAGLWDTDRRDCERFIPQPRSKP